jgi:hypothetical protein
VPDHRGRRCRTDDQCRRPRHDWRDSHRFTELASRFSCAINPKLASKGQRYVGARYVSVGTTTAGSFFADIREPEIQDGQKFYPSGFAVL